MRSKSILSLLVLLSFAGVAAVAGAADVVRDVFAIGPWQPGMSREQALAFQDNGPYLAGKRFDERDASVQFRGGKSKVSLGFDAKGVRFIEVYRYEGTDLAAARAAVLDTFELFRTQFGGASVENVTPDGGKPLDKATLDEALEKILGTATFVADNARRKDKSLVLLTFDMAPLRQPAASRLLAQFGYSAKSGKYYVYLFQDRIDVPLRRAPSNVFLERIK